MGTIATLQLTRICHSRQKIVEIAIYRDGSLSCMVSSTSILTFARPYAIKTNFATTLHIRANSIVGRVDARYTKIVRLPLERDWGYDWYMSKTRPSVTSGIAFTAVKSACDGKRSCKYIVKQQIVGNPDPKMRRIIFCKISMWQCRHALVNAAKPKSIKKSW